MRDEPSEPLGEWCERCGWWTMDRVSRCPDCGQRTVAPGVLDRLTGWLKGEGPARPADGLRALELHLLSQLEELARQRAHLAELTALTSQRRAASQRQGRPPELLEAAESALSSSALALDELEARTRQELNGVVRARLTSRMMRLVRACQVLDQGEPPPGPTWELLPLGGDPERLAELSRCLHGLEEASWTLSADLCSVWARGRLWDLPRGRFRQLDSVFAEASFSPSGRWLAAAQGQLLHLYDVWADRPLWPLRLGVHEGLPPPRPLLARAPARLELVKAQLWSPQESRLALRVAEGVVVVDPSDSTLVLVLVPGQDWTLGWLDEHSLELRLSNGERRVHRVTADAPPAAKVPQAPLPLALRPLSPEQAPAGLELAPGATLARSLVLGPRRRPQALLEPAPRRWGAVAARAWQTLLELERIGAPEQAAQPLAEVNLRVLARCVSGQLRSTLPWDQALALWDELLAMSARCVRWKVQLGALAELAQALLDHCATAVALSMDEILARAPSQTPQQSLVDLQAITPRLEQLRACVDAQESLGVAVEQARRQERAVQLLREAREVAEDQVLAVSAARVARQTAPLSQAVSEEVLTFLRQRPAASQLGSEADTTRLKILDASTLLDLEGARRALLNELTRARLDLDAQRDTLRELDAMRAPE